MAEDNKKRIQRKLEKAKKRFEEKIKFRRATARLNALESAEREKRRLATLSALAMAERKMREQQNEENPQGVESEVDSAMDNMHRIDELDGVREEPEADNEINDRIGDEVKERGRDYLKKRGKQEVKKRVGQTFAKQGFKATAGLVLKHPIVLAVLAGILLIILIVVGAVACSANKSFSEDGGSALAVIDQQNPEHQNAVLQVRVAAGDDRLILADNIRNDVMGDDINNLDFRIIQTLAYLSDKYPIGVNILYSNAPDYTYRQNVSKEALELEDRERALDATSAYKLGQAVGIDSVGTVSTDLSEACNISGPVYVSWQEVVLEGTIRPIHEQLQVDASNLYFQATSIANGSGDVSEQILIANSTLEKIRNNLNILSNLDEGFSGIQIYTTDSLGFVADAAVALNKGSWEDTDNDLMIPVSTMVQRAFRMMQVANMDKWHGNTDNSCRIWKAFEARQNIRQLVVDMMKMPVALARPEDKGFNNNFVVKQLIVFSPEDDLDNGPMDRDVFPPGITSVGIGGMAIGDWGGGDGVVDFRDNHFMSLPIDNGVFSKVCTEFVYKAENASKSGILVSLAPEGLRADMCRLLYGNERVSVAGEISGLVSYKKFIHIGF